MPRITVIVPVYKVEPYLRRCVDSILAQTFTDFELILVDDGSPDNSGAICDEYAKKDARVHVIHQENGGLSAARNAGLDWAFACSNSEWISFIDSDDWVEKEYLDVLFKLVISNEVQCSVCGYSFDYLDQTLPRKTNIETIVSKPDDFYNNAFPLNNTISIIQAWAKLYKKELFKYIRYPVGRINEDRFITHLLLFQCEKIAASSDNLYRYYQSDGSIMRSEWKPYCIDDLDACEEQLKYFKSNCHPQAYKRTLNEYFSILDTQLKRCKDAKQYEIEYKGLKKRQRQALRKYRAESNITFWSRPTYYSYQYPCLSKLFSIVRRCLGRVYHFALNSFYEFNSRLKKRKAKNDEE